MFEDIKIICGAFKNTVCWALPLKFLISYVWGGGLRIHFSNKFLGDADARAHFENHCPRSLVCILGCMLESSRGTFEYLNPCIAFQTN